MQFVKYAYRLNDETDRVDVIDGRIEKHTQLFDQFSVLNNA